MGSKIWVGKRKHSICSLPLKESANLCGSMMRDWQPHTECNNSCFISHYYFSPKSWSLRYILVPSQSRLTSSLSIHVQNILTHLHGSCVSELPRSFVFHFIHIRKSVRIIVIYHLTSITDKRTCKVSFFARFCGVYLLQH